MKYIVQFFCVKCKHVLKENEVYHRNGVCPYCGNISNTSVVDYTKTAIRKETKSDTPPKLGIWKQIKNFLRL